MNLTPFKVMIRERCGLTFDGVAEKPLHDGLRKRMAEVGAENAGQYLAKLARDDHEFHELICLLTINETYFYREPEQLGFLVNRLVPRMLARKQDSAPLRILSAGCSSGEEPYSIAIALREKYGESAPRLFALAGGDIDKGALEKARTGKYSEFSFRSLAAEIRQKYFEREGKWAGRVKEEVRRQVSFYHLNLLDESYSPELQNFDVIFFRNVSIYFDEQTRRTIQQHLAKLLKDDGCLILGTAETLANDLGVFDLVEEDGLFYFLRQAHGAMPLPSKHYVPPMQRESVTDWIAPVSRPSRPASTCVATERIVPPVPPQAFASKAEIVGEALGLMQGKRYDEALALLERQPAANTSLLLKAHILLQRKQYAAAEQSAQQVLATDPWSIDAFVLLGLAAKWQGHAGEAVKWFKQAVYACQTCWPAHYYLAELYRAQNEIEKARRSYRVVLQSLSAAQAAGDGLSIIPLELPLAEVRFLCEHQSAKLGGGRVAAGG